MRSCQNGKQTTVSIKLKIMVSTTKTIEFLHLDLFGPSKSLERNYYGFVIIDV